MAGVGEGGAGRCRRGSDGSITAGSWLQAMHRLLAKAISHDGMMKHQGLWDQCTQ